MKEIILDFTGINSLWNLHEYFKKYFNSQITMDVIWTHFRIASTVLLNFRLLSS